MGFQLIPISVTLNDLERRNSPYFALFHRIRENVTVVEDRPVMSAEYSLPLVAKFDSHSSRTVSLR